MKKDLLFSKLIVITILLVTISTKINAQIHRDKAPLTIDYFTYDKMVNPSNLKIEYSCYYDKSKKIFINAPDGNWSNTTTSDFQAFVNPDTGKPYKVKIEGGVFIVTYDDGFNESSKVNSIKFQGWDGGSYKLVVSDFLN